MSSSSPEADTLVESTKSFEEERKALLSSMAAQLTTVVEKVVQINENMADFNAKQSAVSDVAKLWNESYNRDSETISDHSLSVYTNTSSP